MPALLPFNQTMFYLHALISSQNKGEFSLILKLYEEPYIACSLIIILDLFGSELTCPSLVCNMSSDQPARATGEQASPRASAFRSSSHAVRLR